MNVNGTPYRTVWMTDNIVYLINQPKLPHHFEVLPHHDTESVAVAIETMVVREALGLLVLQVLLDWHRQPNWHPRTTSGPMWMRLKHRLAHTRPTAQNLFYGLTKVYEAMKVTSTIAEARSAALLCRTRCRR